MQKQVSGSLLIVVIVLLALFGRDLAQATQQALRVELQQGQQAELSCADSGQLVLIPAGPSSATVECRGAMGPTPTPGPSATPDPAAPTPSPEPTHVHGPSPTPATGPKPIAGHPAGCREGEVFQDSQDWWTHDDPEQNFGHLHTQLCFPVNARIDKPYEVTVVSLMHENPGRFYRLMMQSFNGGLDGDEQLCHDKTAVVCKSFDRTVDRCEQTGGELIDNGQTCRWRDRFTIDPATIDASGMQQFRFRGFVDQPDGTRMTTSTSLHAEVINNERPSNLYKDYGTYNYLNGRGWYTDAQYAMVYLIDAEQLKRPVSGIWRPEVHFQGGRNHDGRPAADVTGHFVAIDTNFHAGKRGTLVLEGDGEFHGRLRIDTTRLSNGWHRLFLKTDQKMPTGHTHSGVLAVWFEVKN